MTLDWFADARVLRLGYALIHFLWQGTLVVLAAAIALHFLRNADSSRRYVVLLGLFLVMAMMPVLTFLVTGAEPVTERVPVANHDNSAELSLATSDEIPSESTTFPRAASRAASKPAVAVFMADTTPATTQNRTDRWLLAIVAAWAIGVVGFSLRLIVGWAGVLRIRYRGLSPVPARVQSLCSTLCAVIPVRRTVRICESALVQVPAVVGWMRPIILLPARLVTGLTEDELRAILAHELAHIRRHDYVVNVLQIVVENVLFYHPAVWWLSRRIRQEREHCCDDVAAAACGGKAIVARTLATLAELHAATPYALPAATGGSLVLRIRRLIQSEPATNRLTSGGLGMGLLIGILITFVAMIINFSRLASADHAVADEPPKSEPEAAVVHVANDDVVAVHSDGIMALAFSPNGRSLAGGSMDGSVRIWDPLANKLLRTLKGSKLTVRAVAFSPDGRTLASGSDDGFISVWDAATGTLKQRLPANDGVCSLRSVVFSPDGETLVGVVGFPVDQGAGNWGSEVALWDVASGTKKRTLLRQNDGYVDNAAFSPDGKTVAAALDSLAQGKSLAGIKLWDSVTGEKKMTLTVEKAGCVSASFSSDGRFLAHGGGIGKVVDGNIRPFPEARLWNVSTGREVRRFSGTGNGYYFCVKFSPDGKYLATGSDGPIQEYVGGKKVLSETQLWDVATGKLIWKSAEGLGRVNAISISPDGETIAVCDSESLRLLRADTGETQQVLMTRTLGPVKVEDDATKDDETSKCGRPLNNEEKLEALELIAETTRANFDRIQTWTGAYQFHDRIRFNVQLDATQQALFDNMLVKGNFPPLHHGEIPTGKEAGIGYWEVSKGIASFSLDNVQGRLHVFYDQADPAGIVDVPTGAESQWKGVGTDIHWLFTPEQSLEFEPLTKRGQVKDYPHIESLPGSTRVVYRHSTLHGQRFNGRIIDPRTLFSDIGSPSWEHCEFYAAGLRGERGDQARDSIANKCTIYVNSELPPTYTEVATMKNGSELITVYDGKVAFNVVEYTQTGKEGLHRQHKTTYRKADETYIPDTYEFSHYNPREGKNVLINIRSLQLVHATLNGEIPESEFTMEPFQLKYGERMVDGIENRLKVYDDLIGFVPAEGFVYDPIRLNEGDR